MLELGINLPSTLNVCLECSEIHPMSTECTIDEALDCMDIDNLILVDGECICEDYYVLEDGSCSLCDDIYPGSLLCDADEPISC